MDTLHLVILGALILAAGVFCLIAARTQTAMLRDIGAWHD